MTDIFTVTQALQQEMYPFTGDLSELQAAIKPEVYVLFGEALYTMGKNTGVFSELAKGAGTVLDQLGARITYALTSGDGFTLFLKNAVSDLAGWGTLIGNIGGIIGNLLKALPGFGQAFLAVAVSVSHFAEGLSAATIPLQNFLLIGHGLLLWLGLAGTAGAWAISGLLGGVCNVRGESCGWAFRYPGYRDCGFFSVRKVLDCCRGFWLTCLGVGYLSLRLVLVSLAYHFADIAVCCYTVREHYPAKTGCWTLNTLAENIQSTFTNASRSAIIANTAFAEAKESVDQLNQSMQKNGTSALQNLVAIQQTKCCISVGCE